MMKSSKQNSDLSKSHIVNVLNSLIAITLLGSISFAASTPANKTKIENGPLVSRTVASFCAECDRKQASALSLSKDFAQMIEIVGKDDRRPVKPEEEEFFSGVGLIVCENPSVAPGAISATGSLAGSHSTVLTAAHAFWNMKHRPFKRYDIERDCTFRLVASDNSTIIFESKFAKIVADKFYETGEISDGSQDGAVLKLVKSAPRSVAYYGVSQVNSLEDGLKLPIRFAGYQIPEGGKYLEKLTQDHCQFWFDSKDAADTVGYGIQHDCDMLSGASGGPMIYESEVKDTDVREGNAKKSRAKDSKIIAINNRDSSPLTALGFNRAVKISDKVFSAVSEFSREIVAAEQQ